MKPDVKRVYFIQIIDPEGGEYGAERIPVPVNCRFEVVTTGSQAKMPETWKRKYPMGLFDHVISQPRNSQGEFEGFGWIKE